MTVHLMDERFDTGPILAQGSRPMPEDTTLEGLGPTLRELSGELMPRRCGACSKANRVIRRRRRARRTRALRRGLRGARPTPHARRAAAAGRMAPDVGPPVVGPVAEVDGRRVRVLEATLDEPVGEPASRLDASDGPLWLTSSVEPRVVGIARPGCRGGGGVTSVRCLTKP